MTEPQTDIDFLDGITGKTKKEDVVARLKDAAAMVSRLLGEKAKASDEHAARMQKIIADVRVRHAAANGLGTQIQVLFGATHEEWEATQEFLADLEEVLPATLQRLHQGVKVLLDEDAKI